MKNVEELSRMLDCLIECSEKLTETARILKGCCCDVEEETSGKPSAPEPKTYKDVEVREALGQKAKADGRKYKADVKALVEKYSTDGTFKGIDETKYTELMKELEEIGNG